MNFSINVFLFQSKEVIDLDDEEEIDDVEKEVIDIDTPKKRKADDQPQAKKAKVDANWEVIPRLFQQLLDMDWSDSNMIEFVKRNVKKNNSEVMCLGNVQFCPSDCHLITIIECYIQHDDDFIILLASV